MAQPTPAQATPTDESMQEVPITSRQRLLPLLVLCVAMMGVGFYFALQPEETSGAREATHLEKLEGELRLELESLGPLEVIEAPVLLSYAQGLPPTRRYLFQQANRTTKPADLIGTTSAMTFLASASTHTEEDTEGYRLDFDEVALRIIAPGSPAEVIGQSVADQLRKTISSSTLTVERQEMGAVESMRWQNRINNQVKPAMSIIESGLTILSPVVPRTPVEPGEPWFSAITLPGVERDAMTLTGKIDVETTLLGKVQGGEGQVWYVLSQKLEVKGKGVVREDRALSYGLDGAGEGLVLFDVKARRLHRQSVTMQTTLRVEREGDAPVEVRSDYLFAFSSLSAAPEVGQQ